MKAKKVQKSTVSTIKRKDLFIKSYQSTIGNICAACRRAKVSRNVYYQWMEKDKTFNEEIKTALDEIHDNVENRLYDIALGGDAKDSSTLNAIKMILAKNRGYSDKVDQTTTHRGEGFQIIINEKK